MTKDTYKTIADPSEGEFKDRGSKFLAYAYPFDDVAQLDELIAVLKSEHPKSRHHCYAYQIGTSGDNYRMNDDGEPSGTAGKPIYGQLLSHELTNVLIVVVRYFGGTLLGASGLINAYKNAAKVALDNAQIITKTIHQAFLLNTPYAQMGEVLNVIKQLDVPILEKEFKETSINILISFPKHEAGQKVIRLKAALLNVDMEQINDETIIDFCTFTPLDERHV